MPDEQQAPVQVKKYTLALGENTYSSPASVNKQDARKLQSLIPSLSGALEREQPKRLLGNQGALGGRIGFFHTYKRNNGGTIVYYFYCATATTLYQWNGIAWAAVSAVGTLADFPVARNINNQMHLSDGTSSWLFDGTSWVKDGLAIPLRPPTFVVSSPSASQSIVTIARLNGIVTMTDRKSVV